MKSTLAGAVLALLSFTCLPAAQAAAPLAAPSGPVVLTVTGDIANKNAGTSAVFDLKMLEGLQGRRATMETPWTTGKTSFEGPYLRAILDAVGAHGKTVKLKALNDYSADVPVADATDYDSILAVKMNDALMSVRDKGPMFMIYPFDLNPELYNEKYFNRSVWQISEIEIVD